MRFIAKTIFAAITMVISGLALLYVTYQVWRSGELHARGYILSASDSPVQFYVVTCTAAIFGVSALLSVPKLLSYVVAPPADSAKLKAAYPKLYGQTRPGLVITLLILFGLMGFAFFTRA